MFIQAARANCRGPAELIINSSLFDSIAEWDTLKAALRSKFRGTYTSSDFYKVLYDIRMTPSQAPMDFFLQLEGHVYQGYRDHREAIGDPSELVKRVFLSGIPAWFQDFLSVKEDGSPTQIAETAQRIWNSRNGIRHSDHQQRKIPTTLIALYGVRICMQCRGPGHLVRDCPFRERQEPLAGSIQGAPHVKTLPLKKGMAVTGPTGWPVAELNVSGSTVRCFIDTGSEATIIKPQALKRIDPHNYVRRRKTFSILRGMSGQLINTLSEVTLVFCLNSDLEMHHTVTVCDVRFPGDILLGMDFMSRTTFSLSSRSQDDSACLTLEGQEFHVNYTDAQSLQPAECSESDHTRSSRECWRELLFPISLVTTLHLFCCALLQNHRASTTQWAFLGGCSGKVLL
ncbi:hypothetical protein C7M84_015746 [Penaeus vannamei]|uniref:CCHC-type domain-containing protein n=1 Tax=Penaeus vannamei TaxID=6689 RepID=A0A3R7MM43_PENVA|nr:hypothetical protein C7M84_015746 [Penaeus vannamei]